MTVSVFVAFVFSKKVNHEFSCLPVCRNAQADQGRVVQNITKFLAIMMLKVLS